MEVKLIWVTPKAEELLVYIARVSAPKNQIAGMNEERLIRHMLGWRKDEYTNEPPHWSPFGMVYACMEITTTRDIGRQILRHRSFEFQEFSQRYADVGALGVDPEEPLLREARLQDKENRQNSLEADNQELRDWWAQEQLKLQGDAQRIYRAALSRGIAKEQARVVLPEGLTQTRMYMTGSLRSWIHYVITRTYWGTQKEHREVAGKVQEILIEAFPWTMEAVEHTEEMKDMVYRSYMAKLQEDIMR